MSTEAIWPPLIRENRVSYRKGKWDSSRVHFLRINFDTTEIPDFSEADHLLLLELAEQAGVTLMGMVLEPFTEGWQPQLAVYFEARSEHHDELHPLAERLRLRIVEALGLDMDSWANAWPPQVDQERYLAFIDAGKDDRAARWSEAEQWVRAVDYNMGNTKIEPAVRELVTALLALGVPTFVSCEGHLEHGQARSGFVGAGRNPALSAEPAEVVAERNSRDRPFLQALLDEFYREREQVPEQALYLDGDGTAGAALLLRPGRPWGFGGERTRTSLSKEEAVETATQAPGDELTRVVQDGEGFFLERVAYADGEAPRPLRPLPPETLLLLQKRELSDFGSFLHSLYLSGPDASCLPELWRLYTERLGDAPLHLPALDDPPPAPLLGHASDGSLTH